MPNSTRFKSRWAAFMLVGLLLPAVGCDSAPPESVSGTIRIEPGIQSKVRKARTMFIFLSPEKGGPPIAVQRLVRVEFPYKYVLTKDDAMKLGQSLKGNVRVWVRLDADGNMGPFVQGDFSGEIPKAVPIGARDADVIINRAGTADPLKVAKAPKGKLPSNHPPMPAATPGQAGPTGSPKVAQAPKGKLPPNHPPMPAMPPAQMPPSSKGKLPPNHPPMPAVPPAQMAPSAPAAPAPAGGGGTISGTIVVAPALAKKAEGKPVLFIVARSGTPGPPLAVARIGNPKFPLKFTLSKANVMMQGMPFQGKVRITVRLDSDGSVGPIQPGDLQGASADLVPVGATNIVITLDKEG